jgi:hypothetical protein
MTRLGLARSSPASDILLGPDLPSYAVNGEEVEGGVGLPVAASVEAVAVGSF